jgi:UPF0271 protein
VTATIDLNADLGEADDDIGRRIELDLLGLVTSAHVACGGHAGDLESMRATVRASADAGVSVGAHPSYPDRLGFGRLSMEMARDDLRRTLRQQITDLLSVTREHGVALHSVKAHGALYADVGRGDQICATLQAVVREVCDPGTALVVAAGVPAVLVLRDSGTPVLEEGFCDRAYAPDGGLVSRQVAGSVYRDPTLAADQALGLARAGTVTAADGTTLTRRVDTLCLHGDSPNAVAMARAVRRALDGAGIDVVAASTRRL